MFVVEFCIGVQVNKPVVRLRIELLGRLATSCNVTVSLSIS